jgi:hypothetical protein
MKCAKASKFVGAFVDNEVKGWWFSRALIKHWRDCKVCQQFVEIQKEMKVLLQTKCEPQKAPVQLKNKIHNLISQN